MQELTKQETKLSDNLNTVEELQRLKELAKTIREQHELAEAEKGKVIKAVDAALTEALLCGQALNEAKELIRHGSWLDWLAEHCPEVAKNEGNTAQRYMRLAKSAHVQDLTGAGIRQAYLKAGIINEPEPKTTKGNDPCQESNKVEPSQTLSNGLNKPKTASTEPSLPRQSPWAPETPGETQSEHNPESSRESTGDYSTGQETLSAEAGSELSQSSQLEPQTFRSSPSPDPEPFQAIPEAGGETDVLAPLRRTVQDVMRELMRLQLGCEGEASTVLQPIIDWLNR